jgi:DNA-binding transcriptional ArsR family regulator
MDFRTGRVRGRAPSKVTSQPHSLDKQHRLLYITYRLYNLIVMYDLDATFAALADPTRRAILAQLAKGEASVTDLAEPFAISQPAISKHLKVLERAGLISRGRDAQRRPRRLEARPLRDATQWLENYRQFWDAQFRRLDNLLHDLQASGGRIKKKERTLRRQK